MVTKERLRWNEWKWESDRWVGKRAWSRGKKNCGVGGKGRLVRDGVVGKRWVSKNMVQ